MTVPGLVRHGVARESWHLQETEHGQTVIVVTEIADRPIEVAGEQYAASRVPFDVWFKEQVEKVTGYDPETTPLGPPTTCVFDCAPGAPRDSDGVLGNEGRSPIR